jgi:hypothetical protein
VTGPDKIMFIRHGEKAVTAPPIGVNENGAPDKHSLIVRGWQRAGALVAFFAHPSRAGIATPATIFAATTSSDATIDSEDARSFRAFETVQPLQAKLGCAYRNDIPVGAESQAAAEIAACQGVVLVCWEHKRIPKIAAAFVPDPPPWGERYDQVWVLDRRTDGSYALSALNQDLLSGDAPA